MIIYVFSVAKTFDVDYITLYFIDLFVKKNTKNENEANAINWNFVADFELVYDFKLYHVSIAEQ